MKEEPERDNFRKLVWDIYLLNILNKQQSSRLVMSFVMMSSVTSHYSNSYGAGTQGVYQEQLLLQEHTFSNSN